MWTTSSGFSCVPRRSRSRTIMLGYFSARWVDDRRRSRQVPNRCESARLLISWKLSGAFSRYLLRICVTTRDPLRAIWSGANRFNRFSLSLFAADFPSGVAFPADLLHTGFLLPSLIDMSHISSLPCSTSQNFLFDPSSRLDVRGTRVISRVAGCFTVTLTVWSESSRTIGLCFEMPVQVVRRPILTIRRSRRQ